MKTKKLSLISYLFSNNEGKNFFKYLRLAHAKKRDHLSWLDDKSKKNIFISRLGGMSVYYVHN